MKDIQDFWFELAEWSQKTFGPDFERGPKGPLKHLIKEANEALEKQTDLEEYADLLFLTFDATRRAGYSFDELLEMCWKKLEKNKKRIWPKPTIDEPVEHERT